MDGWEKTKVFGAIGAAVVVIGNVLHSPPIPVTIAGAILCFALRLMAIRRGWHLPTAHQPDQSTGQS